MKKKIIIIATTIFSFFVISILGLIIFYNVSLNSKDTNSSNDEIVITFESGISSKEIINILGENDLIKNKYVGYVYLKLNSKIVLQAGTYSLNKGMSLKEILSKIENGNVIDDSIVITFIEGKKVINYAKTISDNFDISEDYIIEKLSDQEYLSTLVEKYWFLTEDILNDKLYYALEGYLYPETYHFNKDDDLEKIISKMLDETGKKLSPYKDEIENSEYTIHEILTMASIIELEGSNSDDRKGVSGVFYNRLNAGWSLGSDVTTYYGARVEMSERDLYQKEIEESNNYNTRSVSMAGKLPIGPICNPSINSIIASLEPTEHDYYFFVADKNKKTYFTKTNSEHIQKTNELKQKGLWYEYK